MDKIRVAVRVRPYNRREKELGTTSVVTMKENQCVLHHPSSSDKAESRKTPKSFAFDHCFDALGSPLSAPLQQEEVFHTLGRDILNNAFEGYNACIFAYGQTGSGKSFTMMGSVDMRGLIPRLCDALFERIAAKVDPNITHKVEVSYMEIYNEKVHDLLDPKGSRQMLKVREHNILGPYVDGLSQLAVSSYEDIEQLIEEGNKARTVAATNMNSESSRSHAVFSVILTQTLTDSVSGVSGEKMSRMSLVDLAGSERAVKTGAVGERLKEGSNINKSLTTLGLVISKLADQALGKGKGKENFVPYRDSVLTWLLKDNLGGNSRTVMVATISPSSDNYEETLSTLRYADRAKRIVNHAVVNEDPKAKIIRELRQEVETLREQLRANITQKQGGRVSLLEEESINEKLHESEKLITNLSETWENKLKKTERMQQERQQALEKMGISVEASGISVEKNKYYLVNLNADPCLNEMLVYYLKDVTYVGMPDVEGKPNDIQLSGVGIETHHCSLKIQNTGLFLEPRPNARTCVNGSQVNEVVQLRHGDRILWGFNYFFRVNCPRTSIGGGGSEPQTPAQAIDYNFAREELMLKELSNDPIQAAIQNLERQHEEDKQMALEKQRLEYEKQFQQLRNILSPTTPYLPFDPFKGARMTPSTPTSQLKIEKWAQEREDMFKRGLSQLRQDIMKANSFVKEANFFSDEMGKATTFQVTLQIPPQNLSPNRKRSSFVSEPAILVKRKGKPSQVWSMEKLEHKLIVMRETYNESRHVPLTSLSDSADPFYESQETHNLIGVANVFLECLFHDVRLNYHVPIISQQGEVAGRLQVEISRTMGQFPQERFADTLSDSSGDSGGRRDPDDELGTGTITCRLVIKQATGLPPSLSHFVFCQYQFWGQNESEVVAPVVNNDYPSVPNSTDSITFQFDHAKEYVINISEDLIEHCSEGALSIEVWGHRSAGFGVTRPGWEVDQQLAKARSLVDRWRELTRKIEFWVEIQELGECGDYVSVEVAPQKDGLTGGVYQLRQGQQRRVVCRVKPVANSGTLPLICEAITSISIGSICGRLQCQRQLDSYTEEDLNVLREKWSEALHRRRTYLDQHIQKIINKSNKSERDSEREQSLVDQWVSLTEERNAVLVPAPGSNVPGAPADWNPPLGMETHVPVIFLDLNADDFSAQNNGGDCLPCAGTNAIIPKENCNKCFPLQIIKCYEKDVCAVASWDSSIHDNVHLNRITQSDERVYLVVKAVVRLSHPAPMDVVLRKRISVNIYKKQSLTSKFVKSLMGSYNTIYESGIMYEIVSNIPKASEELEDRESLAKMAANADDCEEDGETYIEKYTKGVTSVESILMLDRLRQIVAVKELLQSSGRPLMRKTASVPNFSQLFGSFDTGLDVVARSGSVIDLSGQLNANSSQTSSVQEKAKHRYSLQGPTSASPSPGPVKMALRMKTLHEECPPREELVCQLEEEEEEEDEEEGMMMREQHKRSSEDLDEEESDLASYRRGGALGGMRHTLTQSRTLDSLNEVAAMKAGTPSTISSGYGSGAVSSTTLSEDSLSVRSVSADVTPERDAPSLPLQQSDVSSIISSGESDSSDAKTVVNQQLDTLHISEEETTMSTSIDEEEPPRTTTASTKTPNSKIIDNDNCRQSVTHQSDNQNNNKKVVEGTTVTMRADSAQRRGARNANNRKSLPSFNSPPIVNGAVNENQEVDISSLCLPPTPKSSPAAIPDWCVVGESVQIRPYNYSGVVAYVGPTEFAQGTWVGIELDVPMGKNDGCVNGVRYFSCRPKCGKFVRPDKVILDRRGRAMRAGKSAGQSTQGVSSGGSGPMKRSRSTAERLSDVGTQRGKSDSSSSMRRSKSRGEGLSSFAYERSRSVNARFRK